MPKVSSQPGIAALAEPSEANTRIGIKERLPRIGEFVRQQGALIALIIVVTFSFLRYDNFNTLTIYSVLNFNAQFGLIALGMTFVIMTGGIDLSVGGIAALASVVAALTSSHGFFYALFAAVIAGTLVGIVNGIVVAWMRVPPFIATLATLYIVRGVALRLINDAASVNLDQKSDFITVAGTTVGDGFLNPPVPFTIPLLLVAFLIGILVLRYTRFGRYVLAIGGNPEAAQLMGLPVKRTLFWVYTLSGALAGLVGVLLAINLNGGSATEGNGWELIAIAAVVVGGTLLTGGVGSVFGTLVGVLLLGTIVEILQLENNYTLDHGGGLYLNSFWQNVIRGIFLLIVVLLQSRLQQKRARQRT
ncbi:sugar ABC transporter permease [Ktedonobacter sp. SOSP1-85]|uniref:ABC transporter permease n=1 Tax=Ktedonobacter sp. SOSP1-85 TaxID=2778367 RepID=UPI001916807F|nr:ABC transporter permease [Ktedonobacter sp. SOSP1-85]GHO80450.1 sugar ABC transporter permease [Ktedonobacter sp. SOSP1-85]